MAYDYWKMLKFRQSIRKLNPIKQAEEIEKFLAEFGSEYEPNIWYDGFKLARIYLLWRGGNAHYRQVVPPEFDFASAKQAEFWNGGGADDPDSLRGFGATSQHWNFVDAAGAAFTVSE